MSRLPPIIGITGKASSGKDTLALHLQQKYGYTRRAFADPIKELLNKRFEWTPEQWEDRRWKERPCVITLDVPARDWHNRLSPRQLAQWLGTEVGRNTFGQDCWVRAMENWCRANMDGGDRLVIPDVRFNNEAEWILAQGGRIIRVTHPNAPEVAPHTSEQGVNDTYVNFFLVNNASIEHMYTAIDHYMEGFNVI